MDITLLEERKVQKRFILVLVIILLIIALIIWQGFFVEEKPVLPGEIVKPSKKIEIDFEILESPIIKGLQPFEEIGSIEAGIEIGRENPFVPYLPEGE
jgi:hypothetical protein